MVVDANVWVSGLLPADVHHQASRRWLEGAIGAGEVLAVPTLVFPEVAGAIRRRSGDAHLSAEAVQSILRVPDLRIVSVDRDLGDDAARIANDLAIRGADAVYVAVARRLQLPLVTFDEEVRLRARAIVPTLSPR
jgi:predicted nucleic acid-binding protein